MKILVADDSASVRQIIRLILKDAGHEIVEAKDGIEGLELLSANIGAAFIDYNMPNMNGIELIREIRAGKTNSSVPIIMLTTEAEHAKKEEGRLAGATGWITKPIDEHSLLSVIRTITGSPSP